MAIRLKPIKDQVIVVCGTASGIGRAVARAAAAERARVFLIADDEAAIGEAARAINNAGGRADYAVAATTDAAAVAAAARRAAGRFGRVDAWINDGDRSASDNGCRAAVPLLERGGGALITLVGADAGDGSIAAAVDALRRDLGQRAPRVAASIALLPEDRKENHAIVEAILAALTRPRATITIGDDAGPSTLVGRLAAHRGTVAAIGIGGLALAVGALIARRRGARDA